jgi:hypothetical protein
VQFQKFVKDAIGVAYHPLGTAAIGSVVDENLAVKGVSFSSVTSLRHIN